MAALAARWGCPNGFPTSKLKINHLRSSSEPPELAGFYVDSQLGLPAAQTGKLALKDTRILLSSASVVDGVEAAPDQ